MQRQEVITTPLHEIPDTDEAASAAPEQSSARRSATTRDVCPQSTLRFDIPPTLRPFHLFPFLPVETQDAIWEQTLLEPGINFMNLVPETSESAFRWFVTPFIAPRTVKEEVAVEPDTLTQAPCTLEPVISEAKGDMSNYMIVREQIQKLHVVSQNSRTFIKTFLKTKNVFRNRRGHILSVHPMEDVFFINYINEPDRYNGAGFSVQPVCAELDRIVQVAVRFNHVWKMPKGDHICPVCFWVHIDPRDKGHYPRHLYQFLARCFPYLKQVWIVDYLMRPKLEESHLSQSSRPSPSSARPVLQGTWKPR
jgi:hypothetical protein